MKTWSLLNIDQKGRAKKLMCMCVWIGSCFSMQTYKLSIIRSQTIWTFDSINWENIENETKIVRFIEAGRARERKKNPIENEMNSISWSWAERITNTHTLQTIDPFSFLDFISGSILKIMLFGGKKSHSIKSNVSIIPTILIFCNEFFFCLLSLYPLQSCFRLCVGNLLLHR